MKLQLIHVTFCFQRDKSCTECVEECAIKRPTGCVHPCTRRCHLAPCDSCNVATKTSCHCGLNQVYFKCGEFYPAEEEEDMAVVREKKMSCGNRCIKNVRHFHFSLFNTHSILFTLQFPCGHRCTNICHSGACLNPESCRKKLKIYCDCKCRKLDTTCDKLRAGFKLNCDETCAAKQEEARKHAEAAEQTRRAHEEEQNRKALEEFEKKFGKKKHKERKQRIVEEKNNSKMILWAVGATSALVLSLLIYYFALS